MASIYDCEIRGGVFYCPICKEQILRTTINDQYACVHCKNKWTLKMERELREFEKGICITCKSKKWINEFYRECIGLSLIHI